MDEPDTRSLERRAGLRRAAIIALIGGAVVIIVGVVGQGYAIMLRAKQHGDLAGAVSNGDALAVQYFLLMGADIAGREGVRALAAAAGRGDEEMASMLIDHGADVKASIGPLYKAVGARKRGMVKLLIAKGADVNAQDSSGRTALHLAAEEKLCDMAELLLARGGDPNAKDASGSTPLISAAQYGPQEMAELLLAAGADVDATNDEGQTPLSAALWREREQIARLLIARGADVNTKCSYGWTYWALVPGAEVSARTERNLTPLHIAAILETPSIAELLIEKGADVNAKDKDGNTPLNLAIEQGNDDMAKLLREHGGTE